MTNFIQMRSKRPGWAAAGRRSSLISALSGRRRFPVEQGNAFAQYDLGLMYAQGYGVPLDYVRAYMWLILAASGAGNAETRELAPKIRNFIAAKMTPDQIAEAQRMARDWKPK